MNSRTLFEPQRRPETCDRPAWQMNRNGLSPGQAVDFVVSITVSPLETPHPWRPLGGTGPLVDRRSGILAILTVKFAAPLPYVGVVTRTERVSNAMTTFLKVLREECGALKR